jgi:hypothetical protein
MILGRHALRAGNRGVQHVIEFFLRVTFYLCAGLGLTIAVVWYVTSLYESLTGRSDLVILPFTIAGSSDEKAGGSSEALARMLHARLEQIERDLTDSQKTLLSGIGKVSPPPGASTPQGTKEVVTSIAPPLLFATQGVSLQTRLLEPTQVKISVGGVDVGGLLPWFQKLLVTRRTLEFTYYETPTSVIVSGGLHPLGLERESLRVEVPKVGDKAANLDQVALFVATEIERLRLARDPTNRVEVLSTSEFGTLIGALNEIAQLNRKTAQGRPALAQFADLLARLEPLASDVRDWYQLQFLVAGVAESAGKLDRAAAHYQSAHDTMQAQLPGASSSAQSELRQRIAAAKAKLDELRPKATALASGGEQGARERIALDARHATEAFNKLFKVEFSPLPVKLLPADEPNAYTDGTEFSAPPAIAQLPEITWHNMSWQYINKYLPVFGDLGAEGQTVAYSYSDILPVLIRQLGLIESSTPHSWEVYAGGVAWIKAAIQKRDFKLGDDLRPLRSFANPGSAYNDPVVGKDPQIAHYRDLTPTTEMHAGAGIGGKAFYEAAQRLGAERAGQIWVDALTCLSTRTPVTYKNLAVCLLEVAGADKATLDEALRVVGLGSAPGPTGRASKRRRRPRTEPAEAAPA